MSAIKNTIDEIIGNVRRAYKPRQDVIDANMYEEETARARAAARALQPAPTPAAVPSNPAPVRSGGGVPAVSPTAGITSQYDKIYGDLKTALAGMRDDNLNLIGTASDTIRGNYRDADSDLYKEYTNRRDDLTGRAGNLGVDLDNSTIGGAMEAALRRIQEMSNSNLNSDLSYFEKMKEMKQLAYDALMQGLEQDKMARIAEAIAMATASYSGGGSGGGRGSGGSNGFSQSASETMKWDNANDFAFLEELARTNPAAARAYDSAYRSSGGNPSDALTMLMAQNQKARSLNLPRLWGLGSAVNNAARKQAPSVYGPAINAMTALAGLYNPTVTRSTTSKGK